MSEEGDFFFYPICFDELEHEIATAIVDIHDELVASKGFAPSFSQSQREEIEGKVLSIVLTDFCTYFGFDPSWRYSDLFHQIASFATHLAKDHIFPDGNKRTTVSISLSILMLAGITLDIDDADDPEDNVVYKWIQDVVTGEKTIEELAETLRQCAIVSHS